MEMKVDLSESGLEMFFRPYQIATFELLWKHSGYLSSKDIWEQVNEMLPRSISRASVINFLNASVVHGLLDFKETTGKGGYRRLYSAKYSRDETAKYLSKIVKEKLETLK
jgi:predicted transcriptional regulator